MQRCDAIMKQVSHFRSLAHFDMEYRVAKSIVDILNRQGFRAYFAGGFVRDFILQQSGQDIDIATDARPADIAHIFPKTIAVGAAFGSTVVVKDGFHFEVTTFRSDGDYLDKRHPSNVLFTDAQTDAQRRDFTINGIFYDPLNDKVLDYVDGIADIQKGIIRAIGDPNKRLEEDRLRGIRGVRLAARFAFMIEDATKRAIKCFAKDLKRYVSIERITQEMTKICCNKNSKKAFSLLWDLKLFYEIFEGLKFNSKAHFPTPYLSL